MLERQFIDKSHRIPTYSNLTAHRFEFDQRAQARTAHVKAVLQSTGVEKLTLLGKLSLQGNILPRIGVTKPMAALFGESQPFHSAYMVHPQTPNSLVRVGGIAKVLNSVQLTAHPTEWLTAESLPVNTAYWAASWIDLADGTVVVLQQPVMSLVIIANKITIGKNVTITWERPLPAYVAAKPAKPPKPQRAPTGVSIFKPPAGTPGKPGVPGDPQGVRFKGLDGPEIEIWTLEMTGSPAIDVRGQNGSWGPLAVTEGMAVMALRACPTKLTFGAFARADPEPGETEEQADELATAEPGETEDRAADLLCMLPRLC